MTIARTTPVLAEFAWLDQASSTIRRFAEDTIPNLHSLQAQQTTAVDQLASSAGTMWHGAGSARIEMASQFDGLTATQRTAWDAALAATENLARELTLADELLPHLPSNDRTKILRLMLGERANAAREGFTLFERYRQGSPTMALTQQAVPGAPHLRFQIGLPPLARDEATNPYLEQQVTWLRTADRLYATARGL